MRDEHGVFDEGSATEDELRDELCAQIIDTWAGQYAMKRVRGHDKLILSALLRALAFGFSEVYDTNEGIWAYLVYALPAEIDYARDATAALDTGERGLLN